MFNHKKKLKNKIKPLNQNKMKKILCWLGWHKYTCSIQDLINEFGYVPLDDKMPPNAKCVRCNKTFKSE
jgi:hypothetical protein